MGQSRLVKILLCLALVSVVVSADEPEISISASINKTNAPLNATLILKVEVQAKNLNDIPNPTLPNFTGNFEVQSSSQSTSFTWINGKITNSRVIQYQLTPLKRGTLIVDPVTIRINKKTLKTKPIKVQITAPIEEPYIKTAPILVTAPLDESVFLKATASPNTVLIGEPIHYQLKLYRRVHIWSNVSIQAPNLEGFWSKDNETEPESIQTVNGERVYVFELVDKTLYPLNGTEILIPKTAITLITNPLDGRRLLESNDITINVVTLPTEGQPDNFKGAVGDFQLTSISNQAEIVKKGDPLTLRIQLSGDGNKGYIQSLNWDKSPDYRVYPTKTDGSKPTIGTNTKWFDYIVVPETSGTITLPRFSLYAFSPKLQNYYQISSQEQTITVSQDPNNQGNSLPSKQAVIITESARYLNDDQEKPTLSNPLHSGLLVIALILNAVLIGFNLIELLSRFTPPKKTQKSKQQRLKNVQVELKELKSIQDIKSLSAKLITLLKPFDEDNSQKELKDFLSQLAIEAYAPIQSNTSRESLLNQANAVLRSLKEDVE